MPPVDIAAPAKINLCLRVIGRRPDGYHLLDSTVAPIDVFDTIRVSLASQGEPGIELDCRTDSVGSTPAGEANLAVRAARAYMEAGGLWGRVTIRMRKRIPIGAGLGGGSSDAAAVLRGLSRLTGGGVTDDLLKALALRLGADVPFFLFGRPARMRGVGERLGAAGPLPRGHYTVVWNGQALSTAAVFAAYDRALTTSGRASSIAAPSGDRDGGPLPLVNDLEEAAFQVQPELRSLKRRLGALGPRAVFMTGSGSAFVAVWDERATAVEAAGRMQEEGIWSRPVRILRRVPDVTICG